MTGIKHFTLEEARRTLPLVKRIAADIQRLTDELDKIPGGIRFVHDDPFEDQLAGEFRASAIALRNQLVSLTEELTEIGVELKGLQPVLIDFLSVRDNREICLCWAMGEDDIMFWHPIESGYTGRQSL